METRTKKQKRAETAVSKLDQLRTNLDQIDQFIVEALGKRNNFVNQIAKVKLEHGRQLRDIKREHDLMLRLSHLARTSGLNQNYVTKLYEKIIEQSLKLQLECVQKETVVGRNECDQTELMDVCYLESSPQSMNMAQNFFAKGKNELNFVEHFELGELFSAIAKSKQSYGIVSVDAGSKLTLTKIYHHLADLNLQIVGDVFFAANNEGLGGDERFLVIAKEAKKLDPTVNKNLSLVFSLPSNPAAHIKALGVFDRKGIKIRVLESLSSDLCSEQCRYALDLELNVTEDALDELLLAFREQVTFLRVMGVYESRTQVCTDTSLKLASQVSKSEPTQSGGSQLAPAVIEELKKKPYRLVSLLNRSGKSVIQVKDVKIGAEKPIMIAGPCSVESWEQIYSVAKLVASHKGAILRGGCFKPRTHPYAFQGLGMEGLRMLKKAGDLFGLPVVTEVLHPNDVFELAKMSDVIQIGARNMQNFALLKEVGKINKPVILKRGLMATIDEWLSAAEYILAAGNQQVILCERGIRTFETATRNTLDLSAVAVLKERTHLPVIVDPSHASGTWRYIPALTKAAYAVGADGVMVEVHPQPTQALSDGPQALKFDTYVDLVHSVSDYI